MVDRQLILGGSCEPTEGAKLNFGFPDAYYLVFEPLATTSVSIPLQVKIAPLFA